MKDSGKDTVVKLGGSMHLSNNSTKQQTFEGKSFSENEKQITLWHEVNGSFGFYSQLKLKYKLATFHRLLDLPHLKSCLLLSVRLPCKGHFQHSKGVL